MVIKLPQGEKFRKFALTHGDKTQVEMASLWQGEISERTSSRALKKIGFTQKKRPTAFQEGSGSQAAGFHSRVVYLTQARKLLMLMNQGWMSQINSIMRVNKRGQRFHALKSGRRKGPVNMMAALCNQKLSAPFTSELRVIELFLKYGLKQGNMVLNKFGSNSD